MDQKRVHLIPFSHHQHQFIIPLLLPSPTKSSNHPSHLPKPATTSKIIDSKEAFFSFVHPTQPPPAPDFVKMGFTTHYSALTQNLSSPIPALKSCQLFATHTRKSTIHTTPQHRHDAGRTRSTAGGGRFLTSLGFFVGFRYRRSYRGATDGAVDSGTKKCTTRSNDAWTGRLFHP